MLSLESLILGKQRRQRAQQDEGGEIDSFRRGMATRTLPERLVLADGRTLEWYDTVLRDRGEVEAPINSYAVSKNGQHILTCLDNGFIKLWDLYTGRHMRDFIGHDESVLSVSFSPDNAGFVSGSEDSTAMLWNVDDGTVASTLSNHTDWVWSVGWSPDGKTIATGSVDQTACLWNLDGSLRSSLPHDGQVTLLDFSPNGEFLLTTADSVAHLWNCAESSLCYTVAAHSGPIWSTRFSADGERIITASEDGTSRIWDARNGDELVVLREHMEPVWAAEFSPDGQYVASGSQDGMITVCDSFTGEEEFNIARAPLAHIYTLAYSHSGDYIASGDAGGLVKLWNGKSGAFLAEFQGHDEKVKSVTWTQDDRFVVSSSEDGTVRGWSILDVLRLQ